MPRTYQKIRAKVRIYGLSGRNFTRFTILVFILMVSFLSSFSMIRMAIALFLAMCGYVFFVWWEIYHTAEQQRKNSLPDQLDNCPR